MSDPIVALLSFIGLLLASGFFVAAEFAIFSARRAQIEPRAEAGSKPAKLTIKGMENVSQIVATCQLGITISALLILTVVEPSIKDLLKQPLSSLGLGKEAVYATSFLIALTVVTFLHVLIGEMVPKNIAFSIPERAALVLVPIAYGISIVMRPVVGILNGIANAVLRLFGVTAVNEANSAYTLDQVENIVQHSTREGVLSDETGAIGNTFEFTDKKVQDILVPIDHLVTFTLEVTPREIEQAVAKYGFSRYIILDEQGEIEGYLHLKDVIDSDEEEADEPVQRKLIRTVKSIGGTVELEDALALMKRDRQHLMANFNDDGKLVGLLFLEDILEELVGEVKDATRRD
ncbi:MAG: hemolysin family protein [Rhodoluna sp.]|nr:hemolysin family protein [Rhodoluna sp.]